MIDKLLAESFWPLWLAFWGPLSAGPALMIISVTLFVMIVIKMASK